MKDSRVKVGGPSILLRFKIYLFLLSKERFFKKNSSVPYSSYRCFGAVSLVINNFLKCWLWDDSECIVVSQPPDAG